MAKERPAGSRWPAAGLLLLVCAALSGAAACTVSVPEILGAEARVEKRPAAGGGSSAETLSVFANIKDSDGLEDIEAMWVVNDAEQLSWLIDDRNWTALNISGETWLGAAGLSMPQNEAFPGGSYRLIVADFAGQRSEISFRIADGASRQQKKAPPSLSSPDALYRARVSSSWPSTYLLAYDAGGLLIGAKDVKTGAINLEALLGGRNLQRAAYVDLYGCDPLTKCGAYSWRIKIR